MGKSGILSALGQPMEAEIDLISVQNTEAATLAARLAFARSF